MSGLYIHFRADDGTQIELMNGDCIISPANSETEVYIRADVAIKFAAEVSAALFNHIAGHVRAAVVHGDDQPPASPNP